MSNNLRPDPVTVNAVVQTSGSSRTGYGLLALLSHTATFPDRSRLYGAESEADDDFDEDSPERRALRGAFAQNPKPTGVLVLKSTKSVTLRYEVGASDASAGATYAMKVLGHGFADVTVTTDAVTGSSQASINQAMLTQLNAVAGRNYTAAFAALPVVGGIAVTADAATDELHHVAHAYQTGDGPIRFTTTTTLPAGLALATDYFVVKVDADNFKVSSTLANAINTTPVVVNITDTGTGTHTATIQAGASSPGSRLVVTCNTANDWFALEPVLLARFDLLVTNAAPAGLGTDLDDILDVDDSWYTLAPLYPSKAYIEALEAWTEANERTLVWDSPDTDVMKLSYDADTSSDVGADSLELGYNRSMGTSHPYPSDFASVRWMGRWLPSLPGKQNTKFKAIVGVRTRKLRAQNKKNITDRKMNFFENFADANRAKSGVVFGTNRWFDVTRNVDWLVDETAVDVTDTLIDDNPFTPEGVQKVAGGVHKAFGAAIAQGVSAQSLPNSVTTPNFDDITDEDKADRILRGVEGHIELAGFVNQVIVNLTITQ